MAITIRPTVEQLKEIDTLKESLNLATSSKALLYVAKDYLLIKDALELEKEKNKRLEWAVDDLKRSIINYSDARQEMIELAK